ncbi:hypothetical protein BHE74_00010357 [Ensete ventricosum]|nr:hypothetical protein BHE74_00010357 [Ensete ventricosum]
MGVQNPGRSTALFRCCAAEGSFAFFVAVGEGTLFPCILLGSSNSGEVGLCWRRQRLTSTMLSVLVRHRLVAFGVRNGNRSPNRNHFLLPKGMA